MLHTASAGAAALLLASWENATAQDKPKGFELPPLPYKPDALEKAIDKQTMEIHHDKHHAAYVANLNKALEKHPELYKKSIDEILRDYEKLPKEIATAVINNGGGHANHTLFWEIMAPNAGGKPSGALAKAIDDKFGSFEKFQAAVKDKALTQFGSGWAWLVFEKGKGIDVINLPNQISPLMSGKTPLMGVDVWEHAYYLRYQNKRADYVDAWWNVANWPNIQARYEKVMKA